MGGGGGKCAALCRVCVTLPSSHSFRDQHHEAHAEAEDDGSLAMSAPPAPRTPGKSGAASPAQSLGPGSGRVVTPTQPGVGAGAGEPVARTHRTYIRLCNASPWQSCGPLFHHGSQLLPGRGRGGAVAGKQVTLTSCALSCDTPHPFPPPLTDSCSSRSSPLTRDLCGARLTAPLPATLSTGLPATLSTGLPAATGAVGGG